MTLSVKDSQWDGNRSCESYKHKFAKQVLAGWFKEAASSSIDRKYAEACGLKWRISGSFPDFGVYEEYPVSSAVKHDQTVWMWDCSRFGHLPTFSDLINAGDTPSLIFDVAILRRDQVVYAFEIVHKHQITPIKAEKLLGLAVTTYVVAADWVLGQINCPDRIKPIIVFDRGNLITSGVV